MSSKFLIFLVFMLLIFGVANLIVTNSSGVTTQFDRDLDTVSTFGHVSESTLIFPLNYVAAVPGYVTALFRLATQRYAYMDPVTGIPGMSWVRNIIWAPILVGVVYGLVMGFAAMISRIF